MEQEKDNFWLLIAGIIVLTIELVLTLKGREMESAGFSSGYGDNQKEADRQIARQRAQGGR